MISSHTLDYLNIE